MCSNGRGGRRMTGTAVHARDGRRGEGVRRGRRRLRRALTAPKRYRFRRRPADPEGTLPGPSRTITVEPIEVPAPVEEPERRPERPAEPEPAPDPAKDPAPAR
jgi:hypothetical protein